MKKLLPIFILFVYVSSTNAQGIFNFPKILNAENHLYQTQKAEALSYRISSLVSEQYGKGTFDPSDSIYYVYDPSLPYGHGNFDFIEFQNFYSDPLFYLCEWLEFTGDWTGNVKFYNIFNGDGMRTAQNVDSWDGTMYTGDGRYEYAYNPDNSLKSVIVLDYTGGDYDSLYKYNYTYSSGKLVNKIGQYYTGGWVNDLIEIYAYNADGLTETLTYQYWSGISWVDSYRIIYTYDEDNNLTEELFQDYAPGWEIDGRYNYTYDAEGFLTTVTTQSYDGTDYTDNQQFEFVEFMDGLPASNTLSYWDGFIWNTNSRVRFNYESFDDGTVDIEEHASNTDFNIYPNPASDIIHIDFYSGAGAVSVITITNNTGQIISKQTFKPVQGKNSITKSLDTDLPAGIYRLNIMHDGLLESKSFIKN